MIIDECLLVFVHSQAEPVVPRPSRARKPKAKEEEVKVDLPQASSAPMHSIEELAIIGCVDSMPVMQATKRVRAPTTMAARPRLGRSRQPVAPTEPRRTRRSPVSELASQHKRSSRRKPLAASPPAPRAVRVPATANTPTSLIANLTSPDTKMIEMALELSRVDVISEPVLPIHTAIRTVLQATLILGRPYDTNMLSSTFGVSRSVVMQSLRKYYEGFVEQSMFTEEVFVPTYLWLYGLEGNKEAIESISRAIKISGAAEPGSRSAFAIARDFVILYITEVIHDARSKSDLAGLSSVAAVINSIKTTSAVPPCFIEITNSFLYRARMTGRAVLRAKPELGGIIANLF